MNEQLVFDIIAHDRASRTFDKVGRSAEEAGDDIEGMGKQAHGLDKQIDDTRDHMRDLIAEFDRTGDKTLFKDIRKDRSTLSMLESMRKELHGVSDEAHHAGDNIEGLAKSSKTLDQRIVELRTHVRALSREFERTADMDPFARLRKDKSTLQTLESMREEVANLGKGFSPGDLFQAIPGQAKAVLAPAIVGAIVGTAPTIGAIIGGAVLGGVGLGGIAGGIALAAKDPIVAQAAKGVGHHFVEGLKGEASAAFTGPLLAALGPLEKAGDHLTSMLGKDFRTLAPLVVPLANSVDGFVRALDPGLSKAMKAAEPAVRLIARELPGVGAAIGDMLADIAKNSDGAIMGLKTMFDIMDVGIRFTGELVGDLSSLYETVVRVTGAVSDFSQELPVFGPLAMLAFKLGSKGAHELEGSLNEAKSSGDFFVGTISDLIKGMKDSKTATDEETAALKAFNDEIDKALGITLGVEEANIRLAAAWATTAETLRDGRRTLDLSTEAGRENREALLDLIRAANDVRQAEFEKTGSLDAANKAYDLTIERLRKMAEKLGFSKTAIDELIDSVKVGNAIGGLTVPVTMPGLGRYISNLNYFIAQLGIVKGLAAAEFSDYRRDERNPSGRAGGGMVAAGTSYWVGENGPELVEFGANGRVMSTAQSRAMVGPTSAAPQRLDVVVSFDGGGRSQDLGDALLQHMRYTVRTVGGGDVNLTFGGEATSEVVRRYGGLR